MYFREMVVSTCQPYVDNQQWQCQIRLWRWVGDLVNICDQIIPLAHGMLLRFSLGSHRRQKFWFAITVTKFKVVLAICHTLRIKNEIWYCGAGGEAIELYSLGLDAVSFDVFTTFFSRDLFQTALAPTRLVLKQ